MTHNELMKQIKKAKLKQTLRGCKPIRAKTPAIYGAINKRIAEGYGIEMDRGSEIQYR